MSKWRSFMKSYSSIRCDNVEVDKSQDILLIVVTLIAAVTFQAGVNPPGGVWQDDGGKHKAGTAIYASEIVEFYVFMVFNTVALSTSVLVIMSLTYKIAFQIEVWVATASMLATYASAVFAVTPHNTHKFRFILIAAILPFALRCLVEIFKHNANHDAGNVKGQQNGTRQQKDEQEQPAEA